MIYGDNRFAIVIFSLWFEIWVFECYEVVKWLRYLDGFLAKRLSLRRLWVLVSIAVQRLGLCVDFVFPFPSSFL